MLKLEIIRGLKRKSFIISLLIGLILCVANIVKYDLNNILLPYTKYEYFVDDYIKSFITSPYNSFIMFRFTDISNILFIIMPILVSISYGDSYLEDLNSGFLRNILLRSSKNMYFKDKFLSNFIISGLTFTIPLVVNFLIQITTQSNVNPERLIQNNQVIGSLNIDLYLEHPILYTIIWIVIYFIFAGGISSITLAFSIIIKNKFIVLTIPFMVMEVISILFPYIGLNDYNPSYFLYLCPSANIIKILITFLIIITSTFISFYIGGKSNESL